MNLSRRMIKAIVVFFFFPAEQYVSEDRMASCCKRNGQKQKGRVVMKNYEIQMCLKFSDPDIYNIAIKMHKRIHK